MSNHTDRNRAGHILWNVAIVVALVASVGLLINNRQLAGALAQLDQRDQQQIATLQQDLAQSNAAAQKSVDALARQAQDTAEQTAARAKQDLRRTSASLSAALTKQQQDAEQQQQQLTGQLTDLQQANTTAAAKIGEISDNVTGVKSDVASTQSELAKTLPGGDLIVRIAVQLKAADSEIVDLPLNGRNFSQLGLLLPGTAPLTSGLQLAGGSMRGGQSYAVNGMRPESNEFLVDGAENYNSINAGFVLKPGSQCIECEAHGMPGEGL